MTPARPALVLLGGGVRSGKSRFALRRAAELGARRVFVATAEPLDAEMAARIARHRAERAAAFVTVEEPVALAERLASLWQRGGGRRARDAGASGAAEPPDVVVVDCLTLWISNLLVRGESAAAVDGRVAELRRVLGERGAHVILVSNEVGMGLVPETALGRRFRDVMGELHQVLAAEADEIYAGTMGVLLRLHPGPVVAVRG